MATAAVKTRHYNTLLHALVDGAEVDTRDENGWTALMWAAKLGDGPMAQLLMDSGASLKGVKSSNEMVAGLIERKKEAIYLLELHNTQQ